MTARRFLLLQGPCSPFFPRLAQALVAAGQYVHKIHYTTGDRLYWRLYGPGRAATTSACRGPMSALPAFYAAQYAEHRITDIVLFGDCRPVHRPAIELARAHGIGVHVFEEGYFRPHWITLERDGVNGHSRLPRDPEGYRQAATHHDHAAVAFKTAFWKRAAYDVAYHAGCLLNPLLHPGIQSHAAVHPFKEYLGYVKRGLTLPWRERQSQRLAARLIHQAPQHPFYLLPLQLASDAQIVHHSPFANMREALLHVLASFARTALPEARLVVKLHPLDPGLTHYRKQLFAAARASGIEHRVFFLESGPLPALLTACKGVVTVNSTVGSSALIHHRPVMALGTAIYNLPGLSFQGTLDAFWQHGTLPDKHLFQHFRDLVIERTQVNGGFYCAAGIALAVQNSVPRLIAPPQSAIISLNLLGSPT